MIEGGKNITAMDILRSLAMGAAIIIAMSSIQGSRKIIKGIKHELKSKKLKEEYLMQKFYYLRRKKLISFVKNGNEIEMVITENGRKKFLKYNCEGMKIPRPKLWDRKWRLVFFDVPEIKKRARDALVYKLKNLGFLKFNASVWVYPYECRNEIDLVAQFFGVDKFVHYATLSDVTNEAELRYKFGLS